MNTNFKDNFFLNIIFTILVDRFLIAKEFDYNTNTWKNLTTIKKKKNNKVKTNNRDHITELNLGVL